jgi:peroxidase
MQFRTIDGSGNSPEDPGRNAAGDAMVRLAPARYADGVSAPADGPNPRTISNLVVGEGEAAIANTQGLSGMLYAWGQFVDHDLVRTRSDGATRIDVAVPAGDPVFPDGSTIPLTRLEVVPGTGTGTGTPAAAVNRTTGWLDASVVYGSDAATAAALRLPDGRMRTSEGDNLPVVDGAFAAGDPRAAENPSLTALHTLFVREHNWQVERLRAADPALGGDELYERARAVVGAEVARITYEEFLPRLLGAPLPAWRGYDPGADPGLSVEFTGAAWRWGHSAVSAETERKDEAGAVEGGEGFALRDVFFMPAEEFTEGSGAAGFLRHLCTDLSQAMDARIVEDLRNFLVDPPVSMDLAATNIQRGRDLGLQTLNGMREALGLPAHTDFEGITGDAATVAALRQAFGGVDAVDLWTGGLSEAAAPGAFVGPTFAAIIAGQFEALRDGDRLWWEGQGFDEETLRDIEGTSLSDLILRHTDTRFLQDDAFAFCERRDAAAEAEHPDRPQLVVGTGDGQGLVGSGLGDLLAGRAGRQTLEGGAGDDTLAGGDGVDLLRGGTGRDVLRGGTGDDVLDGGAGRDVLEGGAGADLFRLVALSDSPGDAPNRIRDFA